jgi:hypothetical protein
MIEASAISNPGQPSDPFPEPVRPPAPPEQTPSDPVNVPPPAPDIVPPPSEPANIPPPPDVQPAREPPGVARKEKREGRFRNRGAFWVRGVTSRRNVRNRTIREDDRF